MSIRLSLGTVRVSIKHLQTQRHLTPFLLIVTNMTKHIVDLLFYLKLWYLFLLPLGSFGLVFQVI